MSDTRVAATITVRVNGDAREIPWVHHLANCAVTHVVLEPDGPRPICLRDIAHVRALRGAQGFQP